jgi:hypothetical protein
VQRTAVLGLLSITLFLLLFPLTQLTPGSPTSLKADEAAYYMMALSLAHDRDLVLGLEDVDRLFAEFPYRWASNLIVMTDDGWRTSYYGKPYLYSLFAAPFAALWGANGLLVFNMALFLGMIWLGTLYLSRFNDFGLAALFSSLFFLLSSAFAYVFWIQTEVFNMAAVALACFFLFHRPEGPVAPWRAVASGAALALAAYNKPVFLALALPLLFLLFRTPGRWRNLGLWIGGLALSFAAVAGLAVALTGHATPYLGVVRQGTTLCEPGVLPMAEVAAQAPSPEGLKQASNSPTGNAWSWLFRIPDLRPREVAENVSYFLWGRHTGLLLYLPFAAVALLLFLVEGRRDLERWLLLASLVLVAGFFLLFISFNWHGGGGFIGNRYFVNVYPAFLFLVTRIRPRWPMVLGAAGAGLFLGTILFTPLGASGPEPTLQRHVRGGPFRFFPLELSLRNVPGYHHLKAGPLRLLARKDQLLDQGPALWLRAADRVEIWWISEQPLGPSVFAVRSLAPDNRVRLEFEEAEETKILGAGELQRFDLDPGQPGQVRSQKGVPLYIYRLAVTTSAGRVRTWTRYFPPNPCPGFAYNESLQDSFPVGAELSYLGDAARLESDVFALEWGAVSAPAPVAATSLFHLPVTVTNRSGVPWPAAGAASVKLSYHWWTAGGEAVHFDGRRTDLPADLAPGQTLKLEQLIEAPTAPGSYLLELDPVFEYVAWFSQKARGKTLRLPVEVLPAAVGPAAPGVPAGVPANPGEPNPGEPEENQESEGSEP